MNRDELKKHAQKNIDDDLDEDETVFKMPDMDMTFPQGHCYRIALSGSNFNLDIVAPVQFIKDFATFADHALYLALFCSDESVKEFERERFRQAMTELNKELERSG